MSFDEAKYKNTMAYPKESDYFRYNVMSDEGEKVGSFDNKEELAEEFGEDIIKVCNTVSMKVRQEGKASVVFNDYVIVIKYEKNEFRQAIKEYGEEQKRINEIFYNDCCENAGYDPEDPIAKIVYGQAWEDAHSDGLYAVWDKMVDVSDFADKIVSIVNKK